MLLPLFYVVGWDSVLYERRRWNLILPHPCGRDKPHGWGSWFLVRHILGSTLLRDDS